MNLYNETSWNLAFLHPNPDCSNQKKVFEKCEKVFPTTLCMNVSGLQRCREKPSIDCILRKKEFEECLKNGCPPDTCDKRTQYLTLCAKDKPQ
jgi:hypothetical protein